MNKSQLRAIAANAYTRCAITYIPLVVLPSSRKLPHPTCPSSCRPTLI